MKNKFKHIVFVASLTLLMLIPSPSMKAQEDATILTPLLTWWQEQQKSQWVESLRNEINNTKTALESLEKFKNIENYIQKGYKAYSLVRTSYNDLKQLYDDASYIYSYSVYRYKYAEKAFSEGKISLSDLMSIGRSLDFINRYTRQVLGRVGELLTDGDPRSLEERLNELNNALKKLHDVKNILKDDQEDLVEQQEDEEQRQAAMALIQGAYGMPGNYIDSPALKLVGGKTASDAETIVNKVIAKANMDANSSKTKTEPSQTGKDSNSDPISSTASGVSSLGHTVLNIVSIIVFLLGVIMAVPAYMRRNNPTQKQSQDALVKIFTATLIFILALQAVGLLLFPAS